MSQLGTEFIPRVRMLIPVILCVGMPATFAADLYSSASKTWDTTTANWGTGSGGPYDAATWNNPTPDSAIFEGTAGTVTLGESIDIANLTIGIANYVITGNALIFAPGGSIVNTGSGASIASGITGSPTVTANQHLTFEPTAGTVTLGAVSGNGSIVELAGSTTGNSIAGDSNGKLRVDCSGDWTLTGLASAYEHWIVNGNLIVSTGTLRSNNRAAKLQGGTLHYNNPAAVWDGSSGNPSASGGGTLAISGGAALDNSRGSPINTSTYNPDMAWLGDWTFIGSGGTNSDLYMGSGSALLTGDRQVSIQDAGTTFTVGGPILDAGYGYGLTKAGPGTLRLTGVSTYLGDTTVNEGTLSVTQPYMSDIAGVSVAGGAILNLDFIGTDDVFALSLGGTPVVAGDTAGSLGSGADVKSALLTSTGLLRVLTPTPLDGIRRWDGGITDIAGAGNAFSEGGDGIWSTSITNWDAGAGVVYHQWNNASPDDVAIFSGVKGTVTLAEDIYLGGIEFMDIAEIGYVITGNTLNFAPGSTIVNDNDQGGNNGITVTIESGINGTPAVQLNTGGNIYTVFAPTAGTMTLGPVSGGGLIALGGSTSGNSAASVSGKINCNGTGEWTVIGNAVAYEHFINSGTLVVGGLLRCNNRALHFSGGTLVVNGTLEVAGGNVVNMSAGTTLKGTGLVNDSPLTIPAGATLAPGDDVGTMSLNGDLELTSGSILEIAIDGPAASQIAVTGTVSIAGDLVVTQLVTATSGEYVIIDNDGVEAVTGTFSGLPEGAQVPVGSAIYILSYLGGTNGNDVTLTGGLLLSKSVSTASVNLDYGVTNLIYTLEILNAHTVSLSSITVTDALPAEVSFVTSSVPAVLTNRNVVFDLGTLDAGSNVLITIDVLVTSTVPVMVTNRAWATSAETNVVKLPARGAVETLLYRPTDLAVTKSASILGSNVAYSLVVTNLSGIRADNVVVTDTLPVDTLYAASTPPPDTIVGSDYSFNLGTILPGVATSIALSVDYTGPLPSKVTNVAVVTTTTLEDAITNNIFTLVSVVGRGVDLTMVKTVTPTNLPAGTSNLTYTLTVNNIGTTSAVSVVVTDSLPAGVTFLMAVPPAAQTNGNELTFDLGTIAAGSGKDGSQVETVVATDDGVGRRSGSGIQRVHG